MKFYSFEEIKTACDCSEIARAIGLQLNNQNRCAAIWRGGSNETSVTINRDGWHDFATKESGSAIDLVAIVLFNGDRQRAQEWLGDYLHLTPAIDKLSPNPSQEKYRYHQLLDEGYLEKNVYVYVNESGAPLHHTIRMEHPETGDKQFVQRSALDGRWSLNHIRTVLYNLPSIIDSSWVVIVEGEKDADNLISLGIPATTNAMGAQKWKQEYSESLRGKDVIILPDNDSPGQNHANLVAGHLVNIAKSIRIIKLSRIQKGDVSDWLEREGGTKEKLLEIMCREKPIDTRIIDEQFQIARAKEANKTPFRNYLSEIENDSGRKKAKQIPRHINEMIEDVFTRFIGFPRRVGDELFDRDKDTGDINYIRNVQQLFSWIQQKSKQPVEWTRILGSVSQEQFFEGIRYAAPRYEAISSVPDWPKRADVYYHHAPLSGPSPDHLVFNKLVDFFAPISSEYRVLLKAFFAAPLYYESYIPRPMWIIDSETPGAGKSTLATRAALLYGGPAIEIKTRDFARDMQEVTKRLVSAEGRQARMVLIDNVIGTFASEELSSMVTMPFISGRPPYGRGEERRPNNLTYVITANNASIDNDLAIRSFFIRLKSLENYEETWARDLTNYIYKCRNQIMSDIVDILNNPKQFNEKPFTRFPEFETMILRPMCADQDEYIRVIETIAESRAMANIEEEWGKSIDDLLLNKLGEFQIPRSESVWIRSQVVEDWIKRTLPNCRNPVQLVRNLARSGHCKSIDPAIQIYPVHGELRRRGLLFIGANGSKKPNIIIGKVDERIKIIQLNREHQE